MKDLTIIITFRNEGEQVLKTIKSFHKYVAPTLFNVLCVDDASDDGYDYSEVADFDNVTLVTNSERLGVAGSRDKGVQLAETEFVFLIDGHMRIFCDVISALIGKLKVYKRSLLCLQSKIIKYEGDNLVIDANVPNSKGVKINLDESDKNFLEYSWEQLQESDLLLTDITIACVMGACYAIEKEYYIYLHGLNGLAQWGLDEQFLSAKVWREGGKVLLLKDLEIGHIYSQQKNYRNFYGVKIYNKLIIAYLICPDTTYNKYRETLTSMPEKIADIFNIFLPQIGKEKAYLDSIFTKSYKFLKQKNK